MPLVSVILDTLEKTYAGQKGAVELKNPHQILLIIVSQINID